MRHKLEMVAEGNHSVSTLTQCFRTFFNEILPFRITDNVDTR